MAMVTPEGMGATQEAPQGAAPEAQGAAEGLDMLNKGLTALTESLQSAGAPQEALQLASTAQQAIAKLTQLMAG